MKRPDADKVSLRMESIWLEAENRIIQDVVRRIHKNSKITSTADYQLNRVKELGRSTEEIEKILKESLNATYPEMYKLYDDVSNWQYVRNKDLYEQVNAKFIPSEENEWLIQLSEAIKKQTRDELLNLSQSYGFTVMIGNRRVFTPFSEYYQKYVDSAVMDIISGGYDYNTVIRRVVTQMTNSGLRSVDYASGWSNRTPVAIRRSILTGVSQITRQVNERNAKILGTEYYEVSWHPSARPEHREWQGKVYSHKQLIDICGLGSVTGLCGANCYHDYYPFIPGVSERLYSDKWLEEQNIKESYTKTWQGKEYDAYGLTQKQRQMETAMRAQREKVDALKAAKVDPDEIMLARAKYQAQLDEYGRFCKKMGLQQQRERIYYDMRGRVAPNIKYKINRAAAVPNQKRSIPVNYNEKNDYSINLDGYSRRVNDGLSKAARNVAKLGNEDRCEHMYLVNLNTGKLDYYETNGEPNSVGESNLWKYLKEHSQDNFAFVHNHNTASGFSEPDITTLLKNKNTPIMIAVRNDAVKYVAERDCDVLKGVWFDELYKNELEELNILSRSGKITSEERSVRREQIIVDCLLRDYTKGKGLVEIDGRK